MDNFVDELIEYDEHDKIYRMISYGNFQKYLSDNSEFSKKFDEYLKYS